MFDLYLEQWNNAENLFDQYRLNSNFDDVRDLNNFIRQKELDKLPVKVKEYSEGHNILTLELPCVVLICECCYSLSLNFYGKAQNNLRIRKSKFLNYNAFEVSFGENLVFCELLEIRKFGESDTLIQSPLEIEEHLKSSLNLLNAVYANGIPQEDYFPVLNFLYEDFSDRNLARLMSSFCSIDEGVVLNDIYKSQSDEKPSNEKLNQIRAKFFPFGYEEWKKED